MLLSEMYRLVHLGLAEVEPWTRDDIVFQIRTKTCVVAQIGDPDPWMDEPLTPEEKTACDAAGESTEEWK